MAGPRQRVVRAAGALAVLALVPASAATAATLRIGGAASVPRTALAVGRPPPRTRLHVTFTLAPRDPRALAAYARAVSTPGTSLYRHFLTPAQFARRFGAASGQIALVRSWLRARGLTPGPVSAGALSIPVWASAGALEHGLRIPLHRLSLSRGRTALVTGAARAVPARIAAVVQSVIGLNTVSRRRPLLARAPRRPGAPGSAAPVTPQAPVTPHAATSGPQPCSAARSTATAQHAYTADQIASAYGFPGLYQGGNRGAGTTVAMYELEPVSSSDLASYQSCYGLQTALSYVPVDGGAGSGVGSGEAALDIENLIGLAPAANVIVYTGPNSNSGSPGSGPYDTFSAIINQDRAQVVSVSWGECEAQLGVSDARAENTLFEQAAAQGQTIVAASGDSGSEDCNAGGGLPQTQLAVDDPSSQPLVMGVGGTTLSSLGPRPGESVWNDGGNVAGSLLQPGAGGGGISGLWTMPGGQFNASLGLNVLAAGANGAQCGAPGGYCRQVPDVAADANPATGYVIYWNGSGTSPGQTAGWQVIGGTSGAAPVWAALVALADSSPACGRAPLGDAIPALYRSASADYAGTFNDVQSGNNDFAGTNGGRYAAGPRYDEATGLGSANAAALVPALCAQSLRLVTPPSQRSAARATVSLRLRAADVPGAGLQFSARGLPPGLALNASTGIVTGRPRLAGTYSVTVAAHDSSASAATTSFSWQVGGATRILATTLAGNGPHGPVLAFTVAAGRGAPPVRELVISLPAGLRAASTRGLAVRAPSGARPAFAAHRTPGGFSLILHRGFHTLRVTLSPPGLAARSGRQSRAIRHGSTAVVLRVIDTTGGVTRLHARPVRS
ncbi:MAG: protease pro-enzyme activation domain-containing protein [Solirubrobacteraceae bacterium]